MKAQEQIALLRRACEMVQDWDRSDMNIGEFRFKWSVPDAMNGDVFKSGLIAKALAATATPPDDELPGATVRHVHRAMTAAELVAVTTDVAALRKERDEALAKLAAAQKELAAVCQWTAAKPEPVYRVRQSTIRSETYVQRRVKDPTWATVATCIDGDDAQRIVDALNSAGGGK